MRLKWKLRIYYGALVLVLLSLLGAATAALVVNDFRSELDRRETESTHFARRMLEEHLAAIDSSVARAARDPELLLLARRDLATSLEETLGDWVPLATRLSQRHGLPLFKILDAEGRVLSSAHWPAAYQLADSPGLVLALEAGSGTRLVRERVAEGDFLALEAPRWLSPPRRFVVIGGVRADSLLEADMTERAGTPLTFEMREPGTQDENPVVVPIVQAHTSASLMGQSWVPLQTSPVEASGGLRLAFDRSRLDHLRNRLAWIFGLAALAGALLAWGLGWWISSRVTRPLEQLAEGVAVLAEGRQPQPIRQQGSLELRELVASFNHMAESLAESRLRLRRAERISAWRDVAQRVAHEIKNALAPMQLSVDSVARSLHTGRGDLPSLVAESVATVRGEVDGLTRLVNAFNEMARLPDPEPKPARLHETWERVVASFRDRLEIQSDGLETLPPFLYDDDQVRRALHNLVLNAQEAGSRRILLSASKAQTGYKLALRDDGPGIPAKDLDSVFEPHFTRKNGGTGLGLPIVYKVCADHGWTVTVTSPADHNAPPGQQGTAFTLTIPGHTVAQMT